jgi:transposase-like protein
MAKKKKEKEKNKKRELFQRAEDNLVCPHCGYSHDVDEMDLNLRSSGEFKCLDCGEGFSYDTHQKVTYTTWI